MWNLLRTNRDVRFLFIAQVVSFAGDWFAYVAFVGVVQDISDASILVTLIYVAQTLPAFLMTPVSGPTADRFNRQVVIATVSSVQSVAAIGLLLVDSNGTLWIGYVCLCAISALGSFVGPAAQASLPNLVRSPAELAKASVLFGSLWGAMLAIGAALGGVVAGAFGRDVAFIANAVSFVLATVSVLLIRRPMQAPRDARATRARMRPIADMREALGYARRDSVLLAMLASKATFAMGAGIVGLLAVLVTDEFGGGDRETGMMIAVRGLGVAVGPAHRRAVRALVTGPGAAPVRVVGRAVRRVLPRPQRRARPRGRAAARARWPTSAAVPSGRCRPTACRPARPTTSAAASWPATSASSRSSSRCRTCVAGVLADALGARPTVAVFAVLGIAASIAYQFATRPIRHRLDHEAMLATTAGTDATAPGSAGFASHVEQRPRARTGGAAPSRPTWSACRGRRRAPARSPAPARTPGGRDRACGRSPPPAAATQRPWPSGSTSSTASTPCRRAQHARAQ